jgi:hypothetical protein
MTESIPVPMKEDTNAEGDHGLQSTSLVDEEVEDWPYAFGVGYLVNV